MAATDRHTHPIVRFLTDRGATASIEFALVLPFLLTFYLGVFGVTQAVEARRIVETFVSSAADVITRTAAVDAQDKRGLDRYAAAIVPMRLQNGFDYAVAGVTGDGRVEWTMGDAAAFAIGDRIDLPKALSLAEDDFVVMASARQTYLPIFGYLDAFDTLTFVDTAFRRPRVSERVAFAGG